MFWSETFIWTCVNWTSTIVLHEPSFLSTDPQRISSFPCGKNSDSLTSWNRSWLQDKTTKEKKYYWKERRDKHRWPNIWPLNEIDVGIILLLVRKRIKFSLTFLPFSIPSHHIFFPHSREYLTSSSHPSNVSSYLTRQAWTTHPTNDSPVESTASMKLNREERIKKLCVMLKEASGWEDIHVFDSIPWKKERKGDEG